MIPVLHTQRLVLRGFEEGDVEDVYTYARNPNVGPPAGWAPHENRMESREAVRRFIRDDDSWAIVQRMDGRVIGAIGLYRDAKRNVYDARMMGYVLDEPYWGQGLATEAARAVLRCAFESFHLALVSAIHFPFNTRSRAVIEKCGLRYEGTIRRATQIYSGAVYDDVCYAITREEYFAEK